MGSSGNEKLGVEVPHISLFHSASETSESAKPFCLCSLISPEKGDALARPEAGRGGSRLLLGDQRTPIMHLSRKQGMWLVKIVTFPV